METEEQPEEKATARRRIQSVSVGFRLIRALEAAGEPLTLTQVAAAAEMPTGNAHLYLASYVHEGLVRQHPGTSKYELGPYALQLGLSALRALDLLPLAREELERLSLRCGEASHFSVWSDRGPCIVLSIDGSRPLPFRSRLGSVLPLLSTATGRIFLSHLRPTETRHLLELERPQAGMTDAQIDAFILRTRKEGFSYTENMLNVGLAALAAPVFDYAGGLQGALTILGPSNSISKSRSGSQALALSDSATALSARLGKR